MKKTIVLCIALLLPALCVPLALAQTGEEALPTSFDMKAAVERGLEVYPALVAVRAQYKQSQYNTWAAASDLGPQVSMTYGKNWTENESAVGSGKTKQYWSEHVNVSQTIFQGFELLSNLQKKALNEDYYEAYLTDSELTLISEVQTTFLNLLQARMNVKSAEDSLERLQSQLKVTTAFYEVGLQPKLDVLQAEVDLASAQQTLLSAQNDVSTYHARLNTLMDLPLDAPTEYVGDLATPTEFSQDLKQCLEQAYANRPDIEMALKSARMAAKDSNIALSDLLPAIYADFDWYKRGDDPTLDANDKYWNRQSAEYWTAGVTLSYSLDVLGGDVAEVLAAEQALSQQLATLESTRLEAGFEVKSKFLSLNESNERILVARKSVAAAEESYRMALARYQAQVGTNTDVLDAQSSLSSAEADLIGALADHQTALSELYVAMGVRNLGLE